MKKTINAIYPGTFDPVTNGHIDIIKRAAAIFGQVIVAVVKDSSKSLFFPYSERLDMVRETTEGIKGIKVEGFSGLVVDYACKKKVKIIVRGLRMISDFEYEFQMALTNSTLCPTVETVFLMPHPEYSYISSRLIKEAAFLGADLKKFLPSIVITALKQKNYESRSKQNKQ